MGGGTSGSSSLLGFLIATVVFAVSFATVVQVSVEQANDLGYARGADNSALAASLADLLLSDPGRGWYSLGPACVAGTLNAAGFWPEGVTRLGLAQERCAVSNGPRAHVSNLSFGKVENLYRAQYAADPTNGFVDYEEARLGLGLDAVDLNFHLRSWPVMPSVRDSLEAGYKDPHLRPAYVGDFEELRGGNAGVFLVQHAAGRIDAPSAITLYVNVTNNGTTTTAFSVIFKVPAAHEIVSELHSGLLAPGASDNVTFVLNKTADWTWRSGLAPEFAYTIRDPSKTVGEGVVSLAGLDMTAPDVHAVLTAEAAQLEYDLGGGAAVVDVEYDALDGQGGSNVNGPGWSLRILDADGAQVAIDESLQAKGGKARFSLAVPGVYTAVLGGAADPEAQADRFHVVADELARFTPAPSAGAWQPQPPVRPEAAFLDALIAQFDPQVPDAEYASPEVPFDPAGDVFPDDNRFLADRLPEVLLDASGSPRYDEYNLVVVGSDVDHETLTSGSIKNTLREWVAGGGTLVVFGSGDQAVQWLQPLFHVALQSAGGGVSTPDENNPILTTPNRLDVDSLEDWNTAWRFNGQTDADYFTHVVVKDSQADVVAVSDPGAFGDGRVVLSAWRPYNATGQVDPACDPDALGISCPGLLMLGNFVGLTYRSLYLDYGPPVPETATQGSILRIVSVYHPALARVIELHALVYVFG